MLHDWVVGTQIQCRMFSGFFQSLFHRLCHKRDELNEKQEQQVVIFVQLLTVQLDIELSIFDYGY